MPFLEPLQNPNALDSKVLFEFDHVKNSLKLDDEGEYIIWYTYNDFENFCKSENNTSCLLDLKKMKEDPTYNINASGDIKQMLQELGTEKGKEAALLGGGGSKAQKERAAALAAILSARSRLKEEAKSGANGEPKIMQSFSIVDAASASVHGRSAAAAKAASSDKTAARVALHMAGERAPVNAKLVGLHPYLSLCFCIYCVLSCLEKLKTLIR